MEQLVKVKRGLRDVEPRSSEKIISLEATCERSERLLGGVIGGLLQDGLSACAGSDGDGDAACVSPAQVG
jgi:hypothetical protein